MAVRTLSFAELRGLSDEEKRSRLRDFASTQPLNGELEALDARIRDFETRYETPSSELREKLAAGQIKETLDVCSWLTALSLRESIGKPPS